MKLGVFSIKINVINFVKKLAYNTPLVSEEYKEHCNNFATHCCLSCDRCWGKKYQMQNNKTSIDPFKYDSKRIKCIKTCSRGFFYKRYSS